VRHENKIAFGGILFVVLDGICLQLTSTSTASSSYSTAFCNLSVDAS
jgi:hypothetical protein